MIIIVAFLTRMLFLQIYSYLKTLQLQSNFSFYYLLFDDTFVEATSSLLFQIHISHKYFNILKSCQCQCTVFQLWAILQNSTRLQQRKCEQKPCWLLGWATNYTPWDHLPHQISNHGFDGCDPGNLPPSDISDT